jgi:hypothetical protein
MANTINLVPVLRGNVDVWTKNVGTYTTTSNGATYGDTVQGSTNISKFAGTTEFSSGFGVDSHDDEITIPTTATSELTYLSRTIVNKQSQQQVATETSYYFTTTTSGPGAASAYDLAGSWSTSQIRADAILASSVTVDSNVPTAVGTTQTFSNSTTVALTTTAPTSSALPWKFTTSTTQTTLTKTTTVAATVATKAVSVEWTFGNVYDTHLSADNEHLLITAGDIPQTNWNSAITPVAWSATAIATTYSADVRTFGEDPETLGDVSYFGPEETTVTRTETHAIQGTGGYTIFTGQEVSVIVAPTITRSTISEFLANQIPHTTFAAELDPYVRIFSFTNAVYVPDSQTGWDGRGYSYQQTTTTSVAGGFSNYTVTATYDPNLPFVTGFRDVDNTKESVINTTIYVPQGLSPSTINTGATAVATSTYLFPQLLVGWGGGSGDPVMQTVQKRGGYRLFNSSTTKTFDCLSAIASNSFTVPESAYACADRQPLTKTNAVVVSSGNTIFERYNDIGEFALFTAYGESSSTFFNSIQAVGLSTYSDETVTVDFDSYTRTAANSDGTVSGIISGVGSGTVTTVTAKTVLGGKPAPGETFYHTLWGGAYWYSASNGSGTFTTHRDIVSLAHPATAETSVVFAIPYVGGGGGQGGFHRKADMVRIGDFALPA